MIICINRIFIGKMNGMLVQIPLRCHQPWGNNSHGTMTVMEGRKTPRIPCVFLQVHVVLAKKSGDFSPITGLGGTYR